MKLDSKYFDSIRITKKGDAKAERKAAVPGCEWKGCDKPGPHKAPKGRGKDGEYFRFCGDHARQYNANYNYFDGMNDKDIAEFQRAAQYGHRPTWKSGINPSANPDRTRAEADAQRFADARASRTQGFHAWRAKQATGEETSSPSRRIKPLEKKALDALHLTESATRVEVKARYKDLVKQHHPDVNGGNRASEDKLREIIQAYNLLKQAGLG